MNTMHPIAAMITITTVSGEDDMSGGDTSVIMILILNPLPTNDAHVVSWTLHKPIGVCMGYLILDVVFQYTVSGSFSCFLWLVKG